MSPSNNATGDFRTYKPFIDGLRAIAILTVVCSHIDLPGFGGGYVGVDIFFVISGYLIINQIIADLEKRRFELFDFWARRAFRILPGFLLVMVTCLALATTVVVQPESKALAESFFFSTIMAANLHYLAHQGYFDLAAFSEPFLHMWSLAVEEQFYLLAPLVLLGVTFATTKMNPKAVQRTWIVTTLALAVISFAACVAFTNPTGRANGAFYIMPTRGWEFILGGMIPALVPALRRWPAWCGDCLAMAGIAAIGLAVVLFDADTLYPYYYAGLPALGSLSIIASGLSDPRNTVARLLSTGPMVRIGVVSYAWYLWHWPLISFIRTLNYGEQDLAKETAAVALSLALAALTYRFIELPVRYWRGKRRYRPVRVVAAGTVSCLLVASIGYVWALRLAPFYLPSIAGLDPVAMAGRESPPVSHRAILLGDSEGAAVRETFQERARATGALLFERVRPGCPPLLHTEVINNRGNAEFSCIPFYRDIDFQDSESAIVIARWNNYLGLPPSDPFTRAYVFVAGDPKGEPTNPYEVLATGLAALISKAKSSGVQRILLVGPAPEFPWHAPFCVIRALRTGIALDNCAIPRAKVEARRRHTMETLRLATAGFKDVRLIDPIDVFCTAAECRPNQGRTLYYSDTNHLSPAGADLLYKVFENEFLWALTGNEGGDGLPQGSASACSGKMDTGLPIRTCADSK